MKGLLDGFERLLARLFFFRTLLFFNQSFGMRFKGRQGLDQCRIALVLDDAAAGPGGEIEKGHINETLDIARGPWDMLQAG